MNRPYAALLRGINVGGSRKVVMADLRAMLGDLGFEEPQSVLQTGNLVFSAPRPTTVTRLERLLEAEAARRLGLETDFHVRDPGEWKRVVAENPFRTEAARDPAHLVVVFLKAAVTPARVQALRTAIRGRERVEAAGRHAYVVYPDGIGTSKLTAAVIDRALGTHGTARNWNTVVKVGALLGV